MSFVFSLAPEVKQTDKKYLHLSPSSVSDSSESLTAALSGANSLVIAVGFVPSNPLKMAAAAHEVE